MSFCTDLYKLHLTLIVYFHLESFPRFRQEDFFLKKKHPSQMSLEHGNLTLVKYTGETLSLANTILCSSERIKTILSFHMLQRNLSGEKGKNIFFSLLKLLVFETDFAQNTITFQIGWGFVFLPLSCSKWENACQSEKKYN